MKRRREFRPSVVETLEPRLALSTLPAVATAVADQVERRFANYNITVFVKNTTRVAVDVRLSTGPGDTIATRRLQAGQSFSVGYGNASHITRFELKPASSGKYTFTLSVWPTRISSPSWKWTADITQSSNGGLRTSPRLM